MFSTCDMSALEIIQHFDNIHLTSIYIYIKFKLQDCIHNYNILFYLTSLTNIAR